jgi:tetraacyldisaccharide 4'-kinase
MVAEDALSRIYAAIAAGRRRSYERHPERQKRLSRPVVSIGNISVGGSGKTPAVAHVARLLIADGERPAILTRGYRRRQPTDGVLVVSDGRRLRADLPHAGDEAMMLAHALPGASVLVGADRYLSGLLAERRFGCTVHLLDDGFQRVQLARDVDIVLLSRDDLRDRVLPAGRLREPLSALRRADAVITEVGCANPDPARPAFAYARTLAAAAVPSSPVVAVAGIARPERFFQQLRQAGWPVARELPFPDHHPFARTDVDRLAVAARDCGATLVVTTEKDLMRLLPWRPFPIPVTAIPLDFEIEPAAAFRDWLRARLVAARDRRASGNPTRDGSHERPARNPAEAGSHENAGERPAAPGRG